MDKNSELLYPIVQGRCIKRKGDRVKSLNNRNTYELIRGWYRFRVSDTLSLRYRVSVSRLKSVSRYRVSDPTKTNRYLTPGTDTFYHFTAVSGKLFSCVNFFFFNFLRRTIHFCTPEFLDQLLMQKCAAARSLPDTVLKECPVFVSDSKENHLKKCIVGSRRVLLTFNAILTGTC